MKTQESVNTSKAIVDFICPTFNNGEILKNFVYSLVHNTMEPFRLILVNNGDQSVWPYIPNADSRIVVLRAGENLGWIKGINAGIEWAMAHDPAKYFCFINDDVQITDHDYGWMTKMLTAFHKPGVGAVGPVSNAVMGTQHNKFIGAPPYIESSRLSGMCFLTKRDIIKEIGVLDDSLPGGDDLDYSIRLKKHGYKLGICRRTFLLHHYATTGKRVHGDYWDSREHADKIAGALIKKHGLKMYYATINDMLPAPNESHDFIATEESFAVRELGEICEKGLVLDLGCGGKKFHPKSVGVDIRPNGTMGVGYNSIIASSGEITADVSNLKEIKDKSVDGILAKHLLEHILDPIKTLKEWGRVIKDGGKLVIIVPDWRYCEAISCDPSHVHAFTPDSLSSLIGIVGGFKIRRIKEISPGYVFCISCEKVPVQELVTA